MKKFNDTEIQHTNTEEVAKHLLSNQADRYNQCESLSSDERHQFTGSITKSTSVECELAARINTFEHVPVESDGEVSVIDAKTRSMVLKLCRIVIDHKLIIEDDAEEIAIQLCKKLDSK